MSNLVLKNGWNIGCILGYYKGVDFVKLIKNRCTQDEFEKKMKKIKEEKGNKEQTGKKEKEGNNDKKEGEGEEAVEVSEFNGKTIVLGV